MTATADYSDGEVPKNETAFPLCSATDSLWNKNRVIQIKIPQHENHDICVVWKHFYAKYSSFI